jgi:hypothetical protein
MSLLLVSTRWFISAPSASRKGAGYGLVERGYVASLGGVRRWLRKVASGLAHLCKVMKIPLAKFQGRKRIIRHVPFFVQRAGSSVLFETVIDVVTQAALYSSFSDRAGNVCVTPNIEGLIKQD